MNTNSAPGDAGHGITDPLLTLPETGTDAGEGRRRTHPITPLLRGLRTIPTLVVAAIAFRADTFVNAPSGPINQTPSEEAIQTFFDSAIPEFLRDQPWVAVAVGAVVFTVLATLVSWWQWKRLTYWFDADGDVRVESGIVFRRQRRVQLSRLQTVEITQPLLARIAGMCALRIEVAGQGESHVELQFLTATQAAALRAEILARAAGVRPDAGEAQEQPLVRVPSSTLAISLILTVRFWLALILTVALSAFILVTEGFIGGVFFILTGGTPFLIVIAEFVRFYGFTIAVSPDGLRLRHGMLKTFAQTVPPGRLQALDFVEPLLWRRRGWVRVRINLAGVGASASETSNSLDRETLLLPVAPWPVAVEVLSHVLPGVDVRAIELAGVPARTKWRAPIQWRWLGVGWSEQVFVARRGRVTRHTEVVPHARTQSVHTTQGPWQRRVGAATMQIDSTPGPVTIRALHRPLDEARTLAEQQIQRARTARASDQPERWASRRPPSAT